MSIAFKEEWKSSKTKSTINYPTTNSISLTQPIHKESKIKITCYALRAGSEPVYNYYESGYTQDIIILRSSESEAHISDYLSVELLSGLEYEDKLIRNLTFSVDRDSLITSIAVSAMEGRSGLIRFKVEAISTTEDGAGLYDKHLKLKSTGGILKFNQ